MFKIALISGAPPPDPAEGAYDAPSDSLVVGAFCLRQSQLRAFGACNFPYSGGGNCFHHSGGDRRHCVAEHSVSYNLLNIALTALQMRDPCAHIYIINSRLSDCDLKQ